MQHEAPEITDGIKESVSKLLNVPATDIEDGRLLSDYGLNSIDLIDLVAGLETQYGVQFDPETMKDITSLSLAANVAALLRAK
jgi:acyl carrier protein